MAGLDGVLSDLERLGYEAGPFLLPAAAVGAPHIRERCFVAARISDPARQWGKQRRRVQLTAASDARWRVSDGVYIAEPPRVADGVPDRMERLGALGDSVVVPLVETMGAAILQTEAMGELVT